MSGWVILLIRRVFFSNVIVLFWFHVGGYTVFLKDMPWVNPMNTSCKRSFGHVICNPLKWDTGSCSEYTWFSYCLNSPQQIVGGEWSLFKRKSWGILVLMKQDQQHNSCHGNGTTGVISFLLWCTFLLPNLKYTTVIFLEIFFIECCSVLVEPPMTSTLSSFA